MVGLSHCGKTPLYGVIVPPAGGPTLGGVGASRMRLCRGWSFSLCGWSGTKAIISSHMAGSPGGEPGSLCSL